MTEKKKNINNLKEEGFILSFKDFSSQSWAKMPTLDGKQPQGS